MTGFKESDRMVTISKLPNISAYLSKIDLNEADADFARDMSENADHIYGIFWGKTVVGAAQVLPGDTSFLYIYIFPEYRKRGFASEAVGLLEKEITTPELEEIISCYRSSDAAARAFAEKYGYRRKFASDYMVYSGAEMELEIPAALQNISVRPYQNEDYFQAQALSAKAFHLMRLNTGCFPDSVVDEPSEQMRKNWAQTAEERLVCRLGDEIVGFVHIEGPEIGSISVKPECQGQGIGRIFLKSVINRMLGEGKTEISLCCVVGNTRARRLYDSLGFQEVYCNDYASKKVK